MAFSPDGSRLATLDNNATRLWEARTGKLLLTFPQRGGALAFSWDGTWLFADEGGWINRLDATTGETLQSYTPGAGSIKELAAGPDGRTLAVLSDRGLILNLESGREAARFEESEGAYGRLIFSADGRFVAIGGRVWEAKTGKLLRQIDPGTGFQPPVFSPGLRFVSALPAVNEPSSVHLWDGADGQTLGPVYTGGSTYREISFSPDGETLALLEGEDGGEKRVRSWEIERQQYTGPEFSPVQEALYSLVFSPDGRYLAGGSDLAILVWDVRLGGEPRRFAAHTDHINTLVFSPDSCSLFSAGRDKAILQWDLESGKVTRRFAAHQGDVNVLAFSPDGRWLVSGGATWAGDATTEASEPYPLRVWDPRSGAFLHGISQGDVSSLDFSPDGRWVACQCSLGSVLVDPESGQVLQALPSGGGPFETDISVHAGGRLLVLGQGREIQLWDTGAQQVVLTIQGNQNQLYRVAFSPDGRFLATTGVDGVLRLWRVETSSG